MILEEIEKYDVRINGRQAGEIFKLISKLGIKEDLKKLFFGNEELRGLQREFALKDKEMGEKVQEIILNKMTNAEFKKLSKDEKTKFLNENSTGELLNLQREVRELDLKIKDLSSDGGFDLFSTIIERYPSNQDLFYKVLGDIFNMKEETVAEQSFTIIVAMIKKVLSSQDIKGIMQVFQ